MVARNSDLCDSFMRLMEERCFARLPADGFVPAEHAVLAWDMSAGAGCSIL